MTIAVQIADPEELRPWRDLHRHELHGQVVHDSLHDRAGWTDSHFLELRGERAGYGALAVGGPWEGKPTLFEFYVTPKTRTRLFDLFEALLVATGPVGVETQSNDPLLGVLIHAYAAPVITESILFRDEFMTNLEPAGARVRPSEEGDGEALYPDRPRELGDWVVELDGAPSGTGGLLAHYNRPFEDLYMEIAAPYRRRGLGGYLVQELKRIAYARGSIPTARCNPANVASRRTLQKAGFVPYGHILSGPLAWRAGIDRS